MGRRSHAACFEARRHLPWESDEPSRGSDTSVRSPTETLRLESDYFGRSTPEWSTGWRHFQGGEEAQGLKVEFLWPLGDIVTAVAQAGLRIERLEEYPAERGWRFAAEIDQVQRLPGRFLLVARKDQ